jgi:8-oxo-dGTP pyrophosphatase MutT (NUDIX family)
MHSDDLQEKVLEMVRQSKTAEVLTILETFVKGKDKDLHNEIVMFQSDLSRANTNQRMGIIEHKEWERTIDRIHLAILDNVLERVVALVNAEEAKNASILLKVVVAIVKFKGQFLITERKVKEYNLTWAFPAGIVKPGKTEQEILKKECLQETNIRIKPLFKLGERLHPNTKVWLSYWICDYISGELCNNDTDELNQVKWVSGQEALSLITSDIYAPLKEFLINS